jgi:integrase
MGIKKRGKYYWLDFRIGGKRIRRSLKTDEWGLAIERARDLKNRIIKQYEKKEILIEDFIQEYLSWAWAHKPASADREQQRLRKIRVFFENLGLKHLGEITPYHIEQLRAHLISKGLSKATINRYLQLLRGMFYKAIDWQVFEGPNPVRKVKFFREQPEIKALSDEDIKNILAAAREISRAPKSPVQRIFYDLILFALNTGLRKSEILGLKWKDLAEDKIIVTGKGEKKRVIPLNPTAKEIIARQPRSGDYIFSLPGRKYKDIFRRTIEKIKKMTGIDFHFHLLRHYFTTRLLSVGVDMVTISQLLGHSKPTTSLIYSHSSMEKLQKAVEAIDMGRKADT